MDKELAEILIKFGVDQVIDIATINSGLINKTYRVDTEREQYIFQRINKDIFDNPGHIMENIQLVNATLNVQTDYQIPELIPTLDMKLFYEDLNNYAWRGMKYLSNSISMSSTDSPFVAEEAGRLIGIFHIGTSGIQSNSLHTILPNFHNLQFRSELFLRAMKASDSKALSSAFECISFVENVMSDYSRLESIEAPLRVTHNDTKLNNILFDKDTHKGLCLIDLDTLMPGYLHYDFGDAIRSICNSNSEDETNLDKLFFDWLLFERFCNGYFTKTAGLLSDEEWQTFPTAVELMPFLMALRFLTDYLCGNVYYKTDYYEQNLDRCINQITLVKEIREKRNDIEALINSYR
jgi:Ser/Thr protein kinase RdoA (MazF antagonist)